jgi:hypothetical protein
MVTLFECVIHILYWIVFTAMFRDIEEIQVYYRNLLQKEEKEIDDKEDAEEANAANEIRLARMQEQIDALLEHERIFDTLVTKLYERVDKLDNSNVKEADQKPALAPKPCVEYVDYQMY